VDGWYHTGDMGYISNGELFVIGRKKDIIINGGKNIYPQDLEAIVNEIDGIHAGRVVVFGVPDEQEGTELIAILAETDIEDITEQKQLSKAIRKAIANQTTVTANFVELVEPRWLLKTSSGKIARSANREKWLQSRKK
jgi:acyl-CoA synthetase (AMP-forming)/AMP-acid ligase II